jgi:MFS superfamily sulfate permease-like transporter
MTRARALPSARAGRPAGSLVQDVTASVVVFLVALPLCMGIAVASGAPPEKGLITGVIGGIVVGALSGSPLQVSGPAAGLAVIVFEAIQQHGMSMLGPILALAGIIQLAAGALKLGQWFRAISPAVVHGMLAGIGLLIVAGQIHVLFGKGPSPHGLQNLLAIPGEFLRLDPFDRGAAESAFLVGAITVAAMLAWEKLRPARLKLVPGALLGVLAGTLAAAGLGLEVQRIAVPESILGAVSAPTADGFTRLAEPALLATALAIAFIASAETLLSAAAVDRMHSGPRTRFNRELAAQGLGNLLCGLAGGLPMTGVIVRSSANVQAGAATRLSAVLHGVWLLACVVLLSGLLRQIPSAALAAVLVVTGWRLVSLDHARRLFQRHGVLPAAIWAVTFVTVVMADLLTGVLVGLGLTLLEVLPNLRRLRLHIHHREAGEDTREISLEGAATFLHLPRIARTLETAPGAGVVRLNLRRLAALDHTCAELLGEWLRGLRSAGAQVEVEAPETVRRRLAHAAEQH